MYDFNTGIPKLSLASDGVREWGGEGIGRPYICCLSAIVIFRLLVGDIDPCLSWAETILCCKPFDSFADRDPIVKNYITKVITPCPEGMNSQIYYDCIAIQSLDSQSLLHHNVILQKD